MTTYYVTYEVVSGSIGLIAVKNTHVPVQPGSHDEVWLRIVDQIRMVEPNAKITGYLIDHECDDTMYGDFFC